MSAAIPEFCPGHPTGHRVARLHREATVQQANPHEQAIVHVFVPANVIVESRTDGALLVHAHRTDPNDYPAIEQFAKTLGRMQDSRDKSTPLNGGIRK